VIWLVIGIAVGIISAIRRGSSFDRIAMGTALVLDLGAGPSGSG
jgi:peptide/nickel transport system permease protein